MFSQSKIHLWEQTIAKSANSSYITSHSDEHNIVSNFHALYYQLSVDHNLRERQRLRHKPFRIVQSRSLNCDVQSKEHHHTVLVVHKKDDVEASKR